MASITSIGIGSGLDIESMISQLVAVERAPVTKLQAQASSLQTQLSTYGKLQSGMAALRDAAAALTRAGTWGATTGSSSDAAAVSATTGSNTLPGSYSIEVQRLASVQSNATGVFASADALVGQGTLHIELGTWSADQSSFTPKAGTSAVDISVGPPAPLRALTPRGWSKVRDVDGLTRIWGTGPDEVWFAGTGGQVLRFDGGELREVPGIGAGREVVGLGAAGGARFAATHSPTLVYRYEDGALREVDPWFFRGLTLRFAALIDGEDGALHLLGRSGSDEWWALRNDGRDWSRRPQVIAGSERIASLQPWPAPGAPGALGLTTERLRLVAGRWRRDGDEPVPLLARTGITAVARGGDGALWVGGQVYHEEDGFLCRVRDERWSCVRFPRGVTALSARGDELLVAWTAPGRVLLGSGSARRLPRGPQDLSVQLRERPLTLQPGDEPPERSIVRAILQPPAGPPGEAWAVTGEAIWYRRP